MALDVLGVGMHGLTGTFLVNLLQLDPDIRLNAPRHLGSESVSAQKLKCIDASSTQSWLQFLEYYRPDVIILLSNIRHYPPLAAALTYLSFYPRIIIVGTTGVYSRFHAYSVVYKEIEKMTSAYPGDLCIIRPSMIFGNANDKNLHKVFLTISRFGFLPLVGSGSNLVQPVYYKDLASAIYNALILAPCVKAFDIAGPTALPMINLFSEIFLVLGKKPRFFHLDRNISKLACSIASFLPTTRNFPVTTEQIDRLAENKAFDIFAAQSSLNYSPTPLRKSLLFEAVDLGLV